MFIRPLFVTNSSSSSYIGWGVLLGPEADQQMEDAGNVEGLYTLDLDQGFRVLHPNDDEYVLLIDRSVLDCDTQGATQFNPEYMHAGKGLLENTDWQEKLDEVIKQHNLTPIEGPGWFSVNYHDW